MTGVPETPAGYNSVNGGQCFAAGPLAAFAGIGADAAMFVHLGMRAALGTADAAGFGASLDDGAHDFRVGAGAA